MNDNLTRKPRAIIAADDAALAARATEVLVQRGLDVPHSCRVALADAAEVASRGGAELMLLATSGDASDLTGALRAARTSSSIQIVAMGLATDPQGILATLRDGADEYLDVAQWREELAGAVHRYLERSERRVRTEPAGHVIAILGASGGVGSTTIAVNLGILLARPPHSCALLDIAGESSDMAAMLDIQPQHSLADFDRHASTVDRGLYERLFARHASGVELLSAPCDAGDSPPVSPQTLRLALALGRGRFAFQLLDVPGERTPLTHEALWQADLALLVVRPDFVAARNAHRWLERWEQEGLPRERLRLVLNRAGQPYELPRDQLQEMLGLPVWHALVDDPRRANRALNQGRPLALGNRWSTLGRQLRALAKLLIRDVAAQRESQLINPREEVPA